MAPTWLAVKWPWAKALRGLLDLNLYVDARRDINLTPDYYGHGAGGGFVEDVAVPSDQFHHVPYPEIADAELAAMGMCGGIQHRL